METKIVRWGIIGAGDIVRKRIVPAIQETENSELVAITRGKAELAEAFATEFGIPRWYSQYEELLADKEIDAVYVASPVFLHAEHTIAAARAGKHVLCEKPMALNVDECAKMIEECRANGVKLGIAYYRRFYPVIERIRQTIRKGEIGKPIFAQINTFEAFDPGPDHPRRWFVEKAKSGGGPMMDFGCHRLEILLDLFGKATRVESLNASVRFDREVEDTSAVLLQFETGTCASLVVTHAAQESQDTLDIFGSTGSIHIASLNSGSITIAKGSETKNESHPPSPNFHSPLIEDFADAVLNDREPRITGATGCEVAAIEDTIYGR
ncbi:MAG: Gfo/Idh/MocA family oxidoreductase [Pyrinomonadaceae bacterium]